MQRHTYKSEVAGGRIKSAPRNPLVETEARGVRQEMIEEFVQDLKQCGTRLRNAIGAYHKFESAPEASLEALLQLRTVARQFWFSIHALAQISMDSLDGKLMSQCEEAMLAALKATASTPSHPGPLEPKLESRKRLIQWAQASLEGYARTVQTLARTRCVAEFVPVELADPDREGIAMSAY